MHAWGTVRALYAGAIPLKSTQQLLTELPSSSASSMDTHPQCTPMDLGLALEPPARTQLCPQAWTLCFCHSPWDESSRRLVRQPWLSLQPLKLRKSLFMCTLIITVPLMQYSCLGFHHISHPPGLSRRFMQP